MDLNYVRLCFLGLLSSRGSQMAAKCSAEMNTRFAPKTITVPEVEQLMNLWGDIMLTSPQESDL